MLNRTTSLFSTAILLCLVVTLSGCGPKISMEPPADGVQVRATAKAMTQQLVDKLLDISDDPPESGSEKESIGSAAAVNITPVADVGEFAAKLTFAKVTKTEGWIIWIEVAK